MPGSGKVEKISIVPRGVGALGYTLQLPEEDKFLAGEDELRGGALPSCWEAGLLKSWSLARFPPEPETIFKKSH